MRFKAVKKIFPIVAAGSLLQSAPLLADQDFISAATSGVFTANARLRYEDVSDDAFSKSAEAMTLRTRLAYETAPFYAFTLLTEGENVTHVSGIDNYQLPAPPIPSAVDHAVVADPDGSELNRFQLRYRGISKTDLILGRQYIVYDNQRWIGNVGFRQNDQTFDAFTAVYKGVDDFIMNYAYSDRVNGITPEFDINTSDNLFNVSYNGFTWGKFIAYSYNLQNEDDTLNLAPTLIAVNPGLRFVTNDSIGLRFDGVYNLPTTVPLRAIYRAEYAHQEAKLYDKPNVETTYDADYKLAEVGLVWTFGEGEFALAPLLGYESLGSDDGRYGLQTPYATKHAFNGWVDQFLITPKEGLIDEYAVLGFDWNTYAIKTMLQYHEYNSESDNIVTDSSLNLGSETSVQATKTFGPKWSTGVKYSVYDQAGNLADVAVSGKKDADKIWVWVEFNF
jgi:hypothetical protein